MINLYYLSSKLGICKYLGISGRTQDVLWRKQVAKELWNPRPPMQPTPINALDHVENCVIYRSLLSRSQPEALTSRIALDL
jgi:hypothetical protein